MKAALTFMFPCLTADYALSLQLCYFLSLLNWVWAFSAFIPSHYLNRIPSCHCLFGCHSEVVGLLLKSCSMHFRERRAH